MSLAPKEKEFTPPKPEQPCPCGTGKTFGQCCLPVMKRERKASTAEELMRSRFSAHVARDWEHLHRTFEKTAREPYAPERDVQPREWTRLVIHAHEAGAKPDTATVDFTAYFREGEAEKSFPEKAEFRRVEGEWLYVRALREGPAPIRSTAPAVGRNDPCPCGSGKKYKQCCLGK